jgi:hypothetical protein
MWRSQHHELSLISADLKRAWPTDAISSTLEAIPKDTAMTVLPFLPASRYCDTEKLSNLAWSLFGSSQGGWQRAQAICD